jgi:predicted DNA-binding ribbon-helix-helix protein
MQFYEQWLENDYNPFVLFDENGKIVMVNNEAQFLLSHTTAKEIFDIANVYANVTFGFKTTLFDFRIGESLFYGITVGYLDNDKIGIKLYKTPIKRFISLNENGEFINIYSILDLCISAASISRKVTFKKIFDPTFPDLKLQVEKFTQLVGKIYESHQNTNTITTKLSVKMGEYIKFNNKKYPIFLLGIEGGDRDIKKEQSIEYLANNINCSVYFKPNETILSSAMICA